MTNEFAGARPVGYVADLDAVQAGAVLYFRKWRNGKAARAEIQNEFNSFFGEQKGNEIADNFDLMCECFTRYARRKLLYHGLNCECLGSDEACLANFIWYAKNGEREDAMLLAANLVRPDIALVLVDLALNFALALKQMELSAGASRSNTVCLH